MRTSDNHVYIRPDDTWFAVGLMAFACAIGVAIACVISYQGVQRTSKDAQVCRMNGGQPVENYYGELACVQVNAIKREER